ncbi:MAG: flagellar basal-body rod protein FlgG [Peptococcaceae bacterium]|nr:flagellar basal-body rod protein FlgG [Peptococcaceae bacterium]
MIDALNTGASAVLAQQTGLDAIANDVANVNTSGYKATRTNFADLLYSPTRDDVPANQAPLNGTGAKVAGIQTIFNQGSLVQTGQSTDLAIAGDGFFAVTLPDGTQAYTRNGSFAPDANGTLVNSDGYMLNPPLKVPAGAAVKITSDGKVSTLQNGKSIVLGQLTLATFANPDGLNKLGDNLYQVSANSGAAITGTPGNGNNGTIRSGYLESSNVDLANAMTSLIEAQRAYQANARVITNADQMMSIANNLRG